MSMATYKTLGQANPAATTETDLYAATVPTLGTTIEAVNTHATLPADIRVRLVPGGGTPGTQHYIEHTLRLQPADGRNLNKYESTRPIPFEVDDELKVYATTANVAFTLTGVVSP